MEKLAQQIGLVLNRWKERRNFNIYKISKDSNIRIENIKKTEQGKGNLETFCLYLSYICKESGIIEITNILLEIIKQLSGQDPQEVKEEWVNPRCPILDCLIEVRDYIKDRGKICEIKKNMMGVVYINRPDWPAGNSLSQEEIMEIIGICKKHNCRMSIFTFTDSFGKSEIIIGKE